MSVNYSPVFADSLAEEQFTNVGYTVMPMLSASEIEDLTKLYLDTVPSLPTDFYSTAFLPDCPERRIMTEGMQRVLAPHIARVMPGYVLHSRGYIVKRGGPDQPPLRLHQDYSFVDHSLHRAVHLWIPLVDVDETNGCLTVVPRTHSVITHISAMIDNPSPYDPVRAILDTECTISVPMKAGQAAFFDQRLYHGSRRNTNPGIRIALACALLPRGVTQLLYVVDEDDPGKLNVLEVRDEFTVRFSRGVKVVPPYPDGVVKVGQIEYTAEALTEEKLDSLRIKPATAEAPEPAAEKMPEFVPPPAEKHGLFSRFFGRH
jgi:hypothetical protein